MNKHTAGPWKLEAYKNTLMEQGHRVVDSIGNVICDDEPYYPQEVSIENMRLIAAAPELLEALKQTMSWIDNWSPEFTYDPDWPIDEGKAKAAITKATGESE